MKGFLVFVSLVLASWGGAGSANDTTPTKLVVIGNSLTVHGVAPGLWDHVSGMAASDADHDFAHLVGRGLGLPATAINFADLERNPADAINKIDFNTPVEAEIAADTASIDARTVVVVQLGDNAPAGSTDFPAAYAKLLDAAARARSLICVSTWWLNPTKDASIKTACEAHGGRYVFIGDIYPARQDALVQGEDPAVMRHPHDSAMAEIAVRLLAP